MKSSKIISCVFIFLCHFAVGFRINCGTDRLFSNKLFNRKQQELVKYLTGALVGIISLANISPTNAAEMRYGAMADVGVKEFLVKDGKQLLRLSLPIGPSMLLGSKASSNPGQVLQEQLELIRLRLEQVGFSNDVVWKACGKELSVAETILLKQKDAFIQQSKSPELAATLLNDKIIPQIDKLGDAIRIQDITLTLELQDSISDELVTLRSMQLPEKKLPFTIPSEYNNLPHLNGRANVQMIISHKNGFILPDGKRIPTATFDMQVDGYHAPLTAGNFVDLVSKKYYDNMILKSEELIVQSESALSNKKPIGRTIPLELFYKIDSQPTYDITSDDDNRATDTQSLPFQAYGALGMSRENDQTDSASSDFFFLKWNQALIAPGRNTVDGFYTCFGYVTMNQELLSQITSGDIIKSAVVTNGVENLVVPQN